MSGRVQSACHPEQASFAQRKIRASLAMWRALCAATIARLARFLVEPHRYHISSSDARASELV